MVSGINWRTTGLRKDVGPKFKKAEIMVGRDFKPLFVRNFGKRGIKTRVEPIYST